MISYFIASYLIAQLAKLRYLRPLRFLQMYRLDFASLAGTAAMIRTNTRTAAYFGHNTTTTVRPLEQRNQQHNLCTVS